MKSPVTEKISAFLSTCPVYAEGERILCAVSGGADSMCLLAALLSLGMPCTAAHFNHCLRGAESDRDERFVLDFCEKRGVPVISGRADVAAFAEENSLGTEEAARKLRYAFLERARADLGCAVIATAHNSGDNAETLIYNLTRGAGLRGMGGIPPVRGKIIRPMLACSRSEILEFLDENGISHVEDSTNGEDEYTRNRLRHFVTPVLREINPALDESVYRLSRTLREDADFIDGFAEKALSAALLPDGALSAETLEKEHPAVRRRVLRMFASESGGHMDFKQTEAAEKVLFASRSGAMFDIGGGVRLRREFGRITAAQKRENQPAFEETVLLPGVGTLIPALGKIVYCADSVCKGKISKTINKLLFKKSAIRGNITVRPRRSGDSIELIGSGCTKSLKKLFIEKRIPVSERDSIPVFCDDDGVIGIAGIGAAERMRAFPGDEITEITVRDGTV